MYSLMLMAAVAGGPDASGFGWRSAGCTGCYGTYSTSCYGSCYGSSCYGSSCYGSCYGSCHGGGLFSRLFSGGSCHGSCYGTSCYGSCYGSCHGSGWGSWHRGGCHGSCHGCWAAPTYYGCTGCTGCSGVIINPVPAVPATPAAPAPATPTPATPMKSSTTPAPAALTVELPAGTAKLYVDGVLTAGEGLARKFHTPELPSGQAFFYDLKAEVVVNGAVQTEETRVIVRAGDAVTASFPRLTAAVVSAATVATK